MIYFPKSQPAPASLANKNLRGDDVLLRLKEDFHNKCYICEEKGIVSINIEHFIPHKDDEALKYDWNNLFFVCGYCNNIKLSTRRYDGILNCTNPDHKVTDWIRYGYEQGNLSQIKVIIEEIVSRAGVEPTVNLLSDVYNGTGTINKRLASGNLRDKLHKELSMLIDLLNKFYYDGNMTEEEIQSIRDGIMTHLQKDSAFTAFKIWIIRSKDRFMADFGQYIPD